MCLVLQVIPVIGELSYERIGIYLFPVAQRLAGLKLYPTVEGGIYTYGLRLEIMGYRYPVAVES